MLCVMMLPLVVVGCTSQSSLSVSALTTTASGVIMQPRLADTAERDYFTLRGPSHYAKHFRMKYIHGKITE